VANNILPYKGIFPKIAEDVFIAPTASIIGDVEIGKDSNIWFGCVIRGDVNIVRIGEGTNIQDGTVVHVNRAKWGTFIGNNITIGHMALIHACTLEDNSFVGMHATVMDGCVVEEGAIVGAGALVTPEKRVGKGELWAGSPAKKLRLVNENDRKIFSSTAPHYVTLARAYLDAGIGVEMAHE
jgi:carbonic anhydrase/acetyltransferase-like protein (isoleucine patch superfamily)